MPALTKYCFTLELINDTKLIAEYEDHHAAIWPEVLQSFTDAGIVHLEMYRTGTTVVLLMEVNETFSLEKKRMIDRSRPVIAQWESLMSAYQQSAPGALADEKWVLMKNICHV